jgi:hypothetical protein
VVQFGVGGRSQPWPEWGNGGPEQAFEPRPVMMQRRIGGPRKMV